MQYRFSQSHYNFVSQFTWRKEVDLVLLLAVWGGSLFLVWISCQGALVRNRFIFEVCFMFAEICFKILSGGDGPTWAPKDIGQRIQISVRWIMHPARDVLMAWMQEMWELNSRQVVFFFYCYASGMMACLEKTAFLFVGFDFVLLPFKCRIHFLIHSFIHGIKEGGVFDAFLRFRYYRFMELGAVLGFCLISCYTFLALSRTKSKKLKTENLTLSP